jgi:hypothetical protein
MVSIRLHLVDMCNANHDETKTPQGLVRIVAKRARELGATAAVLVVSSLALCFGSDPTATIVSGVVDVMDSIVPDGSPAFIGSHNQPGDEPL